MNNFYKVFLTLSIFCLTNSVMSFWEFAISTDNKINFYDDKWNHLTTINHFNNPASIAFDETKEKIYFTDRNHKTVSIFSLKIPLDKINIGNPVLTSYDTIVNRLYGNESVKSIAYDPYDDILYWTDNKNHKIYKILLNNITNQPEIVIDFDNSDYNPDSIAIDFCNRKLYWTSYNHNIGKIERSSLDGKNREIFEDKNLHYPHGIFIDYFEHRVYWVVNQHGSEYSVESSNGTHRQIHIKSDYNRPVDLTVTKNHIYWTDTENDIIWNISKHNLTDQPNKILKLKGSSPTGIISRNEYLTHLINDNQCKHIIKEITNREILPSQYSDDIKFKNNKTGLREELCLNNSTYYPNDDKCICKLGFKGRRCEIDECYNYCNNNGKCKFLTNIGPKCICENGFNGERCDINKCNNYCINNGTCTINIEDNKPQCLCPDNVSGERCEINKCHQYCLNNGTCKISNDQPVCHCINGFIGEHCENNSTEICSLLCKLKKYGEITELPFGCNEHCDNFEIIISTLKYENYKEPIAKTPGPLTICSNTYNTTIIFVVLGVVIALLLVFLIVVTLRKIYKPARPRIKKTFVVQKKLSQTPLTSRPVATEQCEIIIENCCNMNICDTPCFDPKILQQSYDSCPTDDKKQLINTSEDLSY